MRITWTCYLHTFTSMGVIAINVCEQLEKLGYDVHINVLNPTEIKLNEYSEIIQKCLQKNFDPNSLGIFFSYPDIYSQVRCKINVGYTGSDSSEWYKSSIPNKTPSDICNELMDYMLTPSNYSKKIMEKCGVKIPIDIFPHGINPNIFKPLDSEKNKDVFTFLYCGELSQRKGTQDLIECFKEIYGNNPKFQLILRANTHMTYYGSSEIINLCTGVSNIKLYWKDKGQEDLVSYLQSANCFVYPTKADWFGMTPFESLACGTPVIATATNGYFEFIRDYIYHLHYDKKPIDGKHPYLLGTWNVINKDDLKTVMQAMVNNISTDEVFDDLCKGDSEKIRRNFSWEQVTIKYLVPFLEKIKEKHFKERDKKNMDEYERITVAIPTKDRPLELALLLESLLNQTYTNFEVLIINDSRTEVFKNSTIQGIINQLNYFNHRVIILNGPKMGPHISGQMILEQAKTELILRLDDDVCLYENFIECLVKPFLEDINNKIGAVGPIYLNPREDLSTQIVNEDLCLQSLESFGKVYWDENNNLYLTGILQNNVINSKKKYIEVEHLNSGFMYRRSAGHKIGGYCLDFSPVGHREESDFSYRLFREGYNLLVSTQAIAMHYHPSTGGIRETLGEITLKENWDHDEKIFLDRMEKLLPKNKELKEKQMVSVIITSTENNKEKVANLIKDIYTFTNHPFEIILIINECAANYGDFVDKFVGERIVPTQINVENNYITIEIFENFKLICLDKNINNSEARNFGVTQINEKSKHICFLDDNSKILGRYSQEIDWIKYLYNLFYSKPDVGAVGPIVTWFSDLKTYCISSGCLFTSKKVWDIIGKFDIILGNMNKNTWSWCYSDTDWSYRLFSKGFRILRVPALNFPFYLETDLSLIEKIDLKKQFDLLLSKYDLNEINMFDRNAEID